MLKLYDKSKGNVANVAKRCIWCTQYKTHELTVNPLLKSLLFRWISVDFWASVSPRILNSRRKLSATMTQYISCCFQLSLPLPLPPHLTHVEVVIQHETRPFWPLAFAGLFQERRHWNRGKDLSSIFFRGKFDKDNGRSGRSSHRSREKVREFVEGSKTRDHPRRNDRKSRREILERRSSVRVEDETVTFSRFDWCGEISLAVPALNRLRCDYF